MVAACAVVVGFFAVRFQAPGKGADDFDRIDKAATSGSASGIELVRAKIGEKRFRDAIGQAIQNRPADWEARLQDWIRFGFTIRFGKPFPAGGGKRPAALMAVLQKIQPPLEKVWNRRQQRMEGAVRIIRDSMGTAGGLFWPELIVMMGSDCRSYSLTAIEALASLGPAAMPALPAMIQHLEGAGNDLTPDILEAVGNIDPDGKESTGRILGLLPKASSSVLVAALPVIGSFARNQPDLATNLWPALERPQDIAAAAVRGLQAAGQLTPDRLERFRGRLKSDDARERWVPLELLRAAGPAAAGFIPELRSLVLHRSSDQTVALTCLGIVLASDSLPVTPRIAAAKAMIASDDPGTAWDAITSLGRIDAGTQQKLDPVTDALAHPSANVRAKAADILGRMGAAARPALPRLRGLQSDPWKMVRDSVELALPKIGE